MDSVLANSELELGHKELNKANATKALKHYTKAVQCSQAHSELLESSYKARSQALTQLSEQEAALRDIQRAKTIHKDNETLAKGKEHKEQFLTNHNQKQGIEPLSDIQELYQGPNYQAPNISAAIRLAYSVEKGRSLHAKYRIPAGSLVLRETAYATVIPDQLGMVLCNDCCRALPPDMIFCAKCGDNTIRYCNEKCRAQARSSYHRLECDQQHANTRATKSLPGKIRHVIRVIISTPISELIDYDPIKASVHSNIGVFGQSPDTDNEPTLLSNFQLLMSLCSHRYDTQNQIWAKSADLVNIYLNNRGFYKDTNWPQTMTLSDRQALIGRLTIEILYKLLCNAHSVTPFVANVNGKDKDKVQATEVQAGAGLYPVYSLVNHSCLPNLFQLSDGASVELRAIRDLECGEELTTNYSALYGLHTFEYRQKHLLDQYKFVCDCEVCHNHALQSDTDNNAKLAFKCLFCDGATAYQLGNQAEICCAVCEKTQDFSLWHVRKAFDTTLALTKRKPEPKTTKILLTAIDWLQKHCGLQNEQLVRAQLEMTPYMIHVDIDHCHLLQSAVLEAYKAQFTKHSLGYEQALARVVMTNHKAGLQKHVRVADWSKELYTLLITMCGVKGARDWLIMDYGIEGGAMFDAIHPQSKSAPP